MPTGACDWTATNDLPAGKEQLMILPLGDAKWVGGLYLLALFSQILAHAASGATSQSGRESARGLPACFV